MRLSLLNPSSAPFFFSEIFVAEPYWFATGKDQPFIIDGGVNIGFSLAYFKNKWPSSRVIGFEPHPDAYSVALKNVTDNRFDGIELYQAALASSEGKLALSFYDESIMASTVTNRLKVRGVETRSIEVNTMVLSKFIDQEVDFLKLDIEGSETEVLEELGEKLRLVRNLFVEFHWTRGDDNNQLAKCVAILEESGFNLLLTSTLSTRISAAVAPLKRCGNVSSLSIFGSRAD